MALKFGKNFPDLSSFQQKISTPRLGGAPREIDLTDKEIASFKNSKKILSDSSITVESLFNLFNEWQSDKTKSIKRFVLSTTFLLALTLPAGINIAAIDLFGVKVGDGMNNIFLISILGVLIFSFSYFDYLRRKDQKIHNAKIESVQKYLVPCLEATEMVDKIAQNNGVTAKSLFNDFRDKFLNLTYDSFDTYKAIKFYEAKLKKTKTSQDAINNIEFYGMYFLEALAIIAILDDLLVLF